MSPVTFKYPWLTHETFPSVDLNDFDVSSQTGFMPPHIPLGRLPEQWELWELLLYDAISSSLQLGEKAHLSLKELTTSERWRRRVREVSSDWISYSIEAYFFTSVLDPPHLHRKSAPLHSKAASRTPCTRLYTPLLCPDPSAQCCYIDTPVHRYPTASSLVLP